MPLKFFTFKTISGNCEQCDAYWRYEGWDNGRWYKAYIYGTKPRLCKRYGASIWVRRRRYQNGTRQPISRVMIISIRSWCKIFLIVAAVAILIDAGVPPC